MTSLTQWAGGALNTNSVAFQAAFLSTDLNSLAGGSAVMSSTAFNNSTGLDQFMDISFVGAITSTTLTAGAGLAFYLAVLQEDGSTYGDGRLTAGTQTTYSPLFNPIGGIPIQAGTVTVIAGAVTEIVIPPRAFRLVIQNNILPATALASSGNSCSISTYRQNTNS